MSRLGSSRNPAENASAPAIIRTGPLASGASFENNSAWHRARQSAELNGPRWGINRKGLESACLRLPEENFQQPSPFPDIYRIFADLND